VKQDLEKGRTGEDETRMTEEYEGKRVDRVIEED
jgi:hypothetical protein